MKKQAPEDLVNAMFAEPDPKILGTANLRKPTYTIQHTAPTKMSERAKAMWRDPELRQRMSQERSEREFSPEHKAKLSASGKARYVADPDARKKVSERFKGGTLTEEHKAKIGASLKKTPWSAERLEKHVEMSRTRVHTPEERASRSERMSNRLVSEETKKKLSEAQRRRFDDPVLGAELRKKISETNTGRKRTEEARKKQSESRKGKTASEETKAKLSASIKRATNTPEAKQAMSERSKARWADPAYRAKFSASRTGAKRSEEAKANIRAGVIKSYENRKENESQTIHH